MKVSVWKGAASWQGAARRAGWKVPGLLGALAAVAVAIAVATAAEPPAAEAQSLSERAILVEIYNATGGNDWTNQTNWRGGLGVGQWHGVTADASGRVTHLRLGDNKLTGPLPASLLVQLTELVQLDLGDNDLTGPLPAEVGQLTKVTHLNLGGNELTGAIPAELGSLTGLTHLQLQDNELTGAIPAELGSLTGLIHLNLGGNGLTGAIPTELNALTNLTVLNLSHNQLTGNIPTQLNALTMLTALNLSHNQLTGNIPTQLNALTALTALNLSHNQLTGNIPTELNALTKLTDLWVNDNSLSGLVPTELNALTFLNNIGLGGNSLTFDNNMIPGWVTDQSAARKEILDLGKMGLSGSFPSGLLRLAHLGELYLDNNSLSGDLPNNIGDMAAIRKLHLNNNMFTGAIPTDISGMGDLIDLRLNDNRMDGDLPAELHDSTTKLEILHLHNNRVGGTGGLSGTIPAGLGNLTRLKELLLHNNAFTGDMDRHWINLVDTLERWTLAGNNFDSNACLRLPLHILLADEPADDPKVVPACDDVRSWDALGAFYAALGGTKWPQKRNWFTNNAVWHGTPGGITGGSTDDIRSLDLSNNGLKGSLSEALLAEIAKCPCMNRLESLWLNGNELTGAIPAELGELTALTELGLDNNELSGAIPAELGELTALTTLWLQNNRLSEEIPAELGDLSALERLRLDDNELRGAIPAELGQLSALTRLRLEHNELSGAIPGELGDLDSLIILWLQDNELRGEIPGELGSMDSLRWLRLNGNKLTGSIPMELGRLGTLQRLYLYENDLDGTIPDLSGLTNLKTVLLHNNGLSGDVPNLSGANDLQILDLSHNALSGFDSALVTKLGDTANPPWPSMTELLLEGNQLGSIPLGLGNLRNLERLALHRNRLSGTIPVELGNPANLQELYLSHNRQPDGNGGFTGGLTGGIPPVLGNPARLRVLWLNDNDLSGIIPPTLGSLRMLEELYLNDNAKPDGNGGLTGGLTGGVRIELGNLIAVQRLRLHNNGLSGPIPSPQVAMLTTLTELRLDGNRLSGSLPADLKDLNRLEKLLLHGNNFDGDIPPEWGGDGVWPALEFLSLDHNGLDNQVPVGLLSRPKLKALYLSHNELTGLSGNIPAGDDALSLEELLLEANMLGALPTGVARLSNLKRLSLNHNGTLMVAIPPELAIDSLVDLYLNDSDFTGDVPDAFDAEMTELATFWIGGNAQLGCVPPSVTRVHGSAMDAHGRPAC